MRKRIVNPGAAGIFAVSDRRWLDLSEIATVEVTSEEDGFPIESVFARSGGAGWRAALPGEQLIRIVFDEPVAIRRIQLRFEEREKERTQQFTLSWCPSTGGSREVVRQQWNFSPAGSTAETEDYEVSLEGVAALELAIRPDIGSGDSVATLASWRVGGVQGAT
jgi:hypothetical protein